MYKKNKTQRAMSQEHQISVIKLYYVLNRNRSRNILYILNKMNKQSNSKLSKYKNFKS